MPEKVIINPEEVLEKEVEDAFSEFKKQPPDKQKIEYNRLVGLLRDLKAGLPPDMKVDDETRKKEIAKVEGLLEKIQEMKIEEKST